MDSEFGDLGLLSEKVEALKWYRQAAKGGDAGAQRRLAHAQIDGELNLAIDKEEALKWYRHAAEGGDDVAQRMLGWAYEHGE